MNPDLEAAHITYLVGLEKSPALLFENIKGHPGHKALYNMIGCNLSRFCLMIGEEPVDHPLKAVQLLQKKFGRKIAPVRSRPNRGVQPEHRRRRQDRHPDVSGAAHVAARRRHLSRHRGRRHHQGPGTGRINVGTYRMMIKGPREIGVYTSPGKDAGNDRDKWWKMGKPAPIAAAYGIDPLLFLVGAMSLPKTESEYEYYSGIKGAPIEMFNSDLTGLPLPAHAEIIIEGLLYPDETFAEGPFGEFTGYYGRPRARRPTCAWNACAIATSDADLRADGRRAVERVRFVLGRVARPASGPTCRSSACRASRAVVDPGPPAGA